MVKIVSTSVEMMVGLKVIIFVNYSTNLGNIFSFSLPWFPYPKNEKSKSVYFIGLS